MPSVKMASEISTLVTMHSPFFSLAFERLTICCSNFTSAALSGPLTFSSEMVNFSLASIFFESCPTESTVTFFEICAEADKGNKVRR